jgi:hypothetical protein
MTWVMPPPWPADAESSAELLSILIREIDRRTEEDDEDLLGDFLFTAWPSAGAQAH